MKAYSPKTFSVRFIYNGSAVETAKQKRIFVATEPNTRLWSAAAAAAEGSSQPSEGFGSGTPTAVFMWSYRTQQNKNFVALKTDLCYNELAWSTMQ